VKRTAGGPAPWLQPHPTHYERLGLPENASAAHVEAAWQLLGRGLPPRDPLAPSLVTPGAVETPALRAAALYLAHAVLSDPRRRAVYDAWLAAQRHAALPVWRRWLTRFKRPAR
jgi:DnaJ-class molecular chaperone